MAEARGRGRPKGSGKSKCWTKSIKSRASDSTSAATEQTEVCSPPPFEAVDVEWPCPDVAVEDGAATLQKPGGWRAVAAQLWASDCTLLFDAEYEENRIALGGSIVSQLPRSSYRRRLKGEALDAYLRREKRRELDLMAAAAHGSNMRTWPLSLVARSIAYFNHTSQIIQRTETQQRRLASRPVVFQILPHLVGVKPPPLWEANCQVFCTSPTNRTNGLV
eukprot:3051774-Pleurochrysis_carterae.AAC.1